MMLVPSTVNGVRYSGASHVGGATMSSKSTPDEIKLFQEEMSPDKVSNKYLTECKKYEMNLNIKNYTCLEDFDAEIVEKLENEQKIKISGDVLEFMKEFPSLQLESGALLNSTDKCDLGTGILFSDFLGLKQISYLFDENYFEKFNYLIEQVKGIVVPISLSMGENQLIVAKIEDDFESKIYLLNDSKEAVCYICDGVANFINNFSDHDFSF